LTIGYSKIDVPMVSFFETGKYGARFVIYLFWSALVER